METIKLGRMTYTTDQVAVVKAYLDLREIHKAMIESGLTNDDPAVQRVSLACCTAGDDMISATHRSPSYFGILARQIGQYGHLHLTLK